jgi:hypothetical protein
VVAGERERAAFADEIGDVRGRGDAEADDVAQALDLIRARVVDRGDDALEHCKVAVDVGDHGDAHRQDASSGCA